MSERSDDLVPLEEVISELKRIAKDTRQESWSDEDAQDWYISGIKDSAHLLMLKWRE